eukprot:2464010-Amphidinium_carterae.1
MRQLDYIHTLATECQHDHKSTATTARLCINKTERNDAALRPQPRQRLQVYREEDGSKTKESRRD